MRRILAMSLLIGAPLAQAQEEDDDFTLEEEDGLEIEPEPAAPPPPPPKAEPKKAAPAKAPAKGEPAPPPPVKKPDAEEENLLEDEEDLKFEDEVDEEGVRTEENLFQDDEDGKTAEEIAAPGADTPAIYRAEMARLSAVPSDEEIMGWEAYLEKYPNSLFKERITARTEELEGAAYRERIASKGTAGSADMAELRLVLPLAMPNLNPRTKIQVAIDAGVPGYFGGLVDFEWALLRNVSVHGGVAGRHTGWGLELGTRYAFVKSAKDQVVATLMADLRIGFSPFTFEGRPGLGVGKIWTVGKSGVDVQLLWSAGASFGTLPPGTAEGADVVDYFGLTSGLHLSVRIAPPVAVFVESDVDLRNFNRPQGLFAYQNLTVGLRFFPKLKTRSDDPIDLAVAGHVPVVSQYTSYGLGGVAIQGAYHLGNKWLKRKGKK